MSSFYDELLPGFASKCWQVHKFGGTSVANANCFLQVANIIEDQLDINNHVLGPNSKHLAVVVSGEFIINGYNNMMKVLQMRLTLYAASQPWEVNQK